MGILSTDMGEYDDENTVYDENMHQYEMLIRLLSGNFDSWGTGTSPFVTLGHHCVCHLQMGYVFI